MPDVWRFAQFGRTSNLVIVASDGYRRRLAAARRAQIMPNLTPKDGDRYVVAEGFECIVTVQFFAPMTGGSTRVLPPGLEFAISGDPIHDAQAVSAKPIDQERWEPELVSENGRGNKKYGGYALIVMKPDLAARCTKT